jgi:hypothetical protein
LRLSGGPNLTFIIRASTNLTDWTPISTNITSAAGTFDFADSQSTNYVRRYYRAVAFP